VLPRLRDFDTEIKQIEHSGRHIYILREHSLIVNTAHEHVFKSLKDTPAGGPIRRRPTGQFQWFICTPERESRTPPNHRIHH
jgi:hypothetical protein